MEESQDTVASKGHGAEIVPAANVAKASIDARDLVFLELDREAGRSTEFSGDDSLDQVVRQIHNVFDPGHRPSQ